MYNCLAQNCVIATTSQGDSLRGYIAGDYVSEIATSTTSSGCSFSLANLKSNKGYGYIWPHRTQTDFWIYYWQRHGEEYS